MALKVLSVEAHSAVHQNLALCMCPALAATGVRSLENRTQRSQKGAFWKCKFTCQGACVPAGVVNESSQHACQSRYRDKMKILGLGARGAHVANRIQQSRISPEVDVWYIDSESKAGTEELRVKRLFTGQAAGPDFSGKQLECIIGPVATGKGNINTGDSGLAFVVCAPSAAPGSSEMLLSLVSALRSAGLFTAVVLATPFEFEGTKRAQSVDSLTSELQSAAHLVAVVEQNALLDPRATTDGSSMTVDQATGIADNALEHSVRCILTAVQAPEILKGSKGALIWHGVELRHFRRLLSPPLQHFLAQPGKAALGRGVASMPQSMLHSVGDCQALMQLASDAAQAATESPFLEGLLRPGCSALCCVSLPLGGRKEEGKMQAVVDQSRLDQAAARLAVQAAAGTLTKIASCNDLIMCYLAHPQEKDVCLDRPLTDCGDAQLRVEVSLLILGHASNNASVAALSGQDGPKMDKSGWEKSDRTATGVKGPRKSDLKTASQLGRGQRLPASTWGALSAIASGGMTGAVEARRPGQPESRERRSGQATQQTAVASQQGPAEENRGRRESPRVKHSAAASVREMITVSAKASDPSTQSVGDQLADTLVAQSLDLPPKAARWRQSQRAKAEHPRLMVQAPEAAWQSQEDEVEGLPATLRSLLGGPQQEFDIRERTFAIVERDRGDAWENVHDD